MIGIIEKIRIRTIKYLDEYLEKYKDISLYDYCRTKNLSYTMLYRAYTRWKFGSDTIRGRKGEGEIALVRKPYKLRAFQDELFEYFDNMNFRLRLTDGLERIELGATFEAVEGKHKRLYLSIYLPQGSFRCGKLSNESCDYIANEVLKKAESENPLFILPPKKEFAEYIQSRFY